MLPAPAIEPIDHAIPKGLRTQMLKKDPDFRKVGPAGVMDYPLNPVDHVLLVTHESLRHRGYCGLSVMLIVDLEGPLPQAELQRALHRLGTCYPALSAHIRYSSILHRPSWHLVGREPLEEAVEYEHHQLDPERDDILAPLNRVIDDPVNVHEGRQLRLVHIEMPGERHRLALRWAHPLMDIEGGHALLGALHDILCGREPSLNPDPAAAFPEPFAAGFPAAQLRAWQGRFLYASYDRLRQPRIVQRPEAAPQHCRVALRAYVGEQRARFEALAKERTAPGPLRYSRAILVALARAYHQMATNQGRPRSHYLFPQSLPLARKGPRPGVCGNHVSIPWIVFAASDLEDRAKADAVAGRQFRDFFEKRRDQAMWYMYRAAARWPFGVTRWLTTHRLPRAAAGFTGYQFDQSVTHLGSARIVNLSGAGPMNCHPGWMFGRTTFGDRMNLSVTYFEDYFDTPNVERFLDLMEQELFGPDVSIAPV
ncbi:MAG TPA: hypothetical protein VJZ71_17905 [Phycisphaerae bacterium]|nr:hypothetical protein [Phycisphaerae bacterium]